MARIALLLACAMVSSSAMAAEFFPRVSGYIETSLAEFDRIPEDRRKALRKIAGYVRAQVESGQDARLNFICTHNSRRSHMSQLWARTAAEYFGIDGVSTYSGGTEATAFNPRAVAAMQRAGFSGEKAGLGDNPLYHVRNGPAQLPMTAFSKVYFHPSNPQEEFCAVMTCSQADESCPVVRGADYRVAIPYDDPKAFDGTDLESARYDERCRQISREMLYLFSQVNT